MAFDMHTCMSNSHVTRQTQFCLTCDMTIRHASIPCVTHIDESRHTYIWVMSHIHQWQHRSRLVCNAKHKHNEDTGWRRLIGYLKSQVIFRKRATNYRALLRKMTYEDKASYDSTPPSTLFLCQAQTRWMYNVSSLRLCFALQTRREWCCHWCICDMAHIYVWRDSFICATWLIHMCDVTHSYVQHNSASSTNTMNIHYSYMIRKTQSPFCLPLFPAMQNTNAMKEGKKNRGTKKGSNLLSHYPYMNN